MMKVRENTNEAITKKEYENKKETLLNIKK